MGGLGSEGIEVRDSAQVVQVGVAEDLALDVVAAVLGGAQGGDSAGGVAGLSNIIASLYGYAFNSTPTKWQAIVRRSGVSILTR
jgi:hypothetical protein